MECGIWGKKTVQTNRYTKNGCCCNVMVEEVAFVKKKVLPFAFYYFS